MSISILPPDVQAHLRSGIAIATPSQCVEELVLNSLDAKATCIAVRLNLQTFKLQVVDNGCGISPQAMKLIGERYATSKCHSVDDLECLLYYGYRGEALASLRDMSCVMEIESRAAASSETYSKIFSFGRMLSVKRSSNSRPGSGTTITLHNFMHNLPVRRKRICETFVFEEVRQRLESIALIHPEVSFSLRNDVTNQKCMQTKKASCVLATFAQLFGQSQTDNLCSVEHTVNVFTVKGFISTCGFYNNSLQFIYVNKRLMLKTRLHKTVNACFAKSLIARSKGRRKSPNAGLASSPPKTIDKWGVYVLDVTCPLSEYDVCLDPNKTLVEFKNWDLVLRCMQEVVETFLTNENLKHCTEESVSRNVCSLVQSDDIRQCSVTCDYFENSIQPHDIKHSLHSLPAKRSCTQHFDDETVINDEDTRNPHNPETSSCADALKNIKPVDDTSTTTDLFANKKVSLQSCMDLIPTSYSNFKSAKQKQKDSENEYVALGNSACNEFVPYHSLKVFKKNFSLSKGDQLDLMPYSDSDTPDRVLEVTENINGVQCDAKANILFKVEKNITKEHSSVKTVNNLRKFKFTIAKNNLVKYKKIGRKESNYFGNDTPKHDACSSLSFQKQDQSKDLIIGSDLALPFVRFSTSDQFLTGPTFDSSCYNNSSGKTATCQITSDNTIVSSKSEISSKDTSSKPFRNDRFCNESSGKTAIFTSDNTVVSSKGEIDLKDTSSKPFRKRDYSASFVLIDAPGNTIAKSDMMFSKHSKVEGSGNTKMGDSQIIQRDGINQMCINFSDLAEVANQVIHENVENENGENKETNRQLLDMFTEQSFQESVYCSHSRLSCTEDKGGQNCCEVDKESIMIDVYNLTPSSEVESVERTTSQKGIQLLEQISSAHQNDNIDKHHVEENLKEVDMRHRKTTNCVTDNLSDEESCELDTQFISQQSMTLCSPSVPHSADLDLGESFVQIYRSDVLPFEDLDKKYSLSVKSPHFCHTDASAGDVSVNDIAACDVRWDNELLRAYSRNQEMEEEEIFALIYRKPLQNKQGILHKINSNSIKEKTFSANVSDDWEARLQLQDEIKMCPRRDIDDAGDTEILSSYLHETQPFQPACNDDSNDNIDEKIQCAKTLTGTDLPVDLVQDSRMSDQTIAGLSSDKLTSCCTIKKCEQSINGQFAISLSVETLDSSCHTPDPQLPVVKRNNKINQKSPIQSSNLYGLGQDDSEHSTCKNIKSFLPVNNLNSAETLSSVIEQSCNYTYNNKTFNTKSSVVALQQSVETPSLGETPLLVETKDTSSGSTIQPGQKCHSTLSTDNERDNSSCEKSIVQLGKSHSQETLVGIKRQLDHCTYNSNETFNAKSSLTKLKQSIKRLPVVETNYASSSGNTIQPNEKFHSTVTTDKEHDTDLWIKSVLEVDNPKCLVTLSDTVRDLSCPIYNDDTISSSSLPKCQKSNEIERNNCVRRVQKDQLTFPADVEHDSSVFTTSSLKLDKSNSEEACLGSVEQLINGAHISNKVKKLSIVKLPNKIRSPTGPPLLEKKNDSSTSSSIPAGQMCPSTWPTDSEHDSYAWLDQFWTPFSSWQLMNNQKKGSQKNQEQVLLGDEDPAEVLTVNTVDISETIALHHETLCSESESETEVMNKVEPMGSLLPSKPSHYNKMAEIVEESPELVVSVSPSQSAVERSRTPVGIMYNSSLSRQDNSIGHFKSTPHLAVGQEQVIRCDKDSETNVHIDSTVISCIHDERAQTTDDSNDKIRESSFMAKDVRCLGQDSTWRRQFDEQLGRNVYIHQVTGLSSFNLPDVDKRFIIRADIDYQSASLLGSAAVPFHPHFRLGRVNASKSTRNAVRCMDGTQGIQKKESLVKWRNEQDADLAAGNIIPLLQEWENPMWKQLQGVQNICLQEVLGTSVKDGAHPSGKSYVNLCPFQLDQPFLNSCKVLNQVDNKFIVCLASSDSTNRTNVNLVVLFDQHAVHERILLEHLQAGMKTENKSGNISVKSCQIEPAMEVSFELSEVRIIASSLHILRRWGFEVTLNQTERTSTYIHSVPAFLLEREASEVKRKRPSVAKSLVQDIIRDGIMMLQATGGASHTIPQSLHNILCSQACHGAVKFGDPLDFQECQELIRLLCKCSLPFQCAHGRPTVVPLLDLSILGTKFVEKVNNKPKLWKIISSIQKKKVSPYIK